MKLTFNSRSMHEKRSVDHVVESVFLKKGSQGIPSEFSLVSLCGEEIVSSRIDLFPERAGLDCPDCVNVSKMKRSEVAFRAGARKMSHEHDRLCLKCGELEAEHDLFGRIFLGPKGPLCENLSLRLERELLVRLSELFSRSQ